MKRARDAVDGESGDTEMTEPLSPAVNPAPDDVWYQAALIDLMTKSDVACARARARCPPPMFDPQLVATPAGDTTDEVQAKAYRIEE